MQREGAASPALGPFMPINARLRCVLSGALVSRTATCDRAGGIGAADQPSKRGTQGIRVKATPSSVSASASSGVASPKIGRASASP